MKFSNEQAIKFTSSESDNLTGIGHVIRPLNGEECDICDVGPMYLIALDGIHGLTLEWEAFEDELEAL